MKTIFLTVYEGVEAKNILRTDVLKTLLTEKDVRIVLLFKDEDRVNYYKKEFTDSRLEYVVTPMPPSNSVDKFFAQLKFYLLTTPTTFERLKILYEQDGNSFMYWVRRLTHIILGRKIFISLARYLDFKLVTDSKYAPFFDAYNPDLVVCANLFEEREIQLLREAKKRNIRSVGYVNTWDRVTARALIRLLPDKLVVFNPKLKQDLSRYHAVDPDKIVVTGVPQYDYYFRGGALSREEFSKTLGLDSKNKLIVYCPIGASFSDSDWEVIDLLYELKNQNKFAFPVDILVRFAPNEELNEEEIKKRPYLKYDKPGQRFSFARGIDWDMNEKDLLHLRNTLANLDVLVTYASSISVDAAIFNKPVINLNFELKGFPGVGQKNYTKLPTKIYKWSHYKDALDSGGIRLVNSLENLVESINAYLRNPHLDEEGRKTLVQEQCTFTDGKSGERIGREILSVTN
ncbi:CDP-glycerol glycerophosphotransferase family protein [Candidatus Parcubacteria bacterium]|nr:CDP-glycerol glycerophosphotransferase family protein [Candidatus Parcubacteria bacterium]